MGNEKDKKLPGSNDLLLSELVKYYDPAKDNFVLVERPSYSTVNRHGIVCNVDPFQIEPQMNLTIAGDMASIRNASWHECQEDLIVESYEFDDSITGFDVHIIKSADTTFVCFERYMEREMIRDGDECEHNSKRNEDEYEEEFDLSH
jgi:hypothetical protein